MNKKQALRAQQLKLERKQPAKKGSYNHLLGNLENQIGPWPAQLFAQIVKKGIEGSMSFADSVSHAKVGLRPDKMAAARTSLLRLGLISFRRWPAHLDGGDYSITEKGLSTVQRYWPQFFQNAQRREVPVIKQESVQPARPTFVVVRPSELNKRPLAA